MMEPWNDSTLLPPPVHTTFSKDSVADLHELRDICGNIIKVLVNQSPLHKESALLSRFVYKYDKKFRNDLGYRNFKKVNTALRRYLTIQFLKDVENFNSTLLSLNDDGYLPTKQMLQYVLIRLMTFAKLMIRICVCSKKSSVFYLDRIKQGESHWMSLMPYALLSRVWSISMVLLQNSCSWYSHLYPWLEKLQLKGLSLLPEKYELPLDLHKWLDMDELDNIGRFNWTPDKCIKINQEIIDDEEGDMFDNFMKYVNKLNDEDNDLQEQDSKYNNLLLPKDVDYEKKDKTQVRSIKSKANPFDQDHGEAISREMFSKMMNKSQDQTIEENINDVPKQAKESYGSSHSPSNVTNKISLQKFMAKEESLRIEGSHDALTSHLSFMQWQALKNSLTALAESLAKNRKIERKFQKIWRDKCMVYIR